MLRCLLAALRKESFSHEIRILKVSDDKEWEFSGTSTVEVLESDKPTIAGIAVSKNPTEARLARLAKEKKRQSPAIEITKMAL